MSAALSDDNPFSPAEYDTAPVYLATPSHEPTPIVAIPGPQFLADVWDDERVPVEPLLLNVIGGKPLLYEGESHSIYGEGGSGKTWVGYLAMLDVTRSGKVAVIVDYESNLGTAIDRLRALGATKDDASRIAYWPFTESLMPSTAAGQAFAAWIDANGPSFVLIDSVARALATAGFDENQNRDYNLWDAGVVAKLVAKRITTLSIDHTGHEGQDGKVKMKAIGASSKANRQSGSCYHFEALVPWTRDNNGTARLTCMKDREGHRAKGTIAAEMHVQVFDNGLRLEVEFHAPEKTTSGQPVLTGYWEAISRILSQDGELSGNQLNQRLEEAGFASAKRLAGGELRKMKAEGYVSSAPGARRATMWTLVRPYTAPSPRQGDFDRHPAADAGGF